MRSPAFLSSKKFVMRSFGLITALAASRTTGKGPAMTKTSKTA
jgi:hypothetical protein